MCYSRCVCVCVRAYVSVYAPNCVSITRTISGRGGEPVFIQNKGEVERAALVPAVSEIWGLWRRQPARDFPHMAFRPGSTAVALLK